MFVFICLWLWALVLAMFIPVFWHFLPIFFSAIDSPKPNVAYGYPKTPDPKLATSPVGKIRKSGSASYSMMKKSPTFKPTLPTIQKKTEFEKKKKKLKN